MELVAKVKELELKLDENVQDVTISERKSAALVRLQTYVIHPITWCMFKNMFLSKIAIRT